MKWLFFLVFSFPLFLNGQSAGSDQALDVEKDAWKNLGKVGSKQSTQTTTMEEYKYATIGYYDDVSKGKDPVKNGYSFNEKYRYYPNEQNLEVRFVEMEKVGCCVKGLIIAVYKNQELKNTYCIPTPGSFLQKKWKGSLMDEFKARVNLIALALADYEMSKLSK